MRHLPGRLTIAFWTVLHLAAPAYVLWSVLS